VQPTGAAAATLASTAAPAPHGGPAASPDRPHTMRGLVMGLHVLPRPGRVAAATVAPRDLRLLVQTKPRRLLRRFQAYGFVLQGAGDVARDSVVLPGPVLELERGKPVRVTVVNNLGEPTGVHWHGLEIESFPDGVPGWSGTPGRIMPPIAPRDSFVAEFTPPRAGTFLYHSHLHELRQIGSGAYGALLVLDRPRDLAHDHVVIAGGGGPPVFAKAESPFAMVNGRFQPAPLRLTAGEEHRLRLVSIHPEWGIEFSLVTDSTVARWRAIAKDGADQPPALATERVARPRMGPGETADFLWTPPAPGRWRMDVRTTTPGFYIPMEVIVTAPAAKPAPPP
jgi:manganese oxidase